jgi:hypothetical protein
MRANNRKWADAQRSRAPWATATPRSLTSFTAAKVYSLLIFVFVFMLSGFRTNTWTQCLLKPAADQIMGEICTKPSSARCILK